MNATVPCSTPSILGCSIEVFVFVFVFAFVLLSAFALRG